MAERKANSTGKMAFGFKVLSHHFDQRPKLKDALLERGYRVIYLKRNIPRQVVSGMVAKLRGKFNANATENYNDESQYTINLEELKSLTRGEIQARADDLAMLESGGWEFIEVTLRTSWQTDNHSLIPYLNFLVCQPILLKKVNIRL